MKCRFCGKVHPNHFEFCPYTGQPLHVVQDSMSGDSLVLTRFGVDSREKIVTMLMNTIHLEEEAATAFVDSMGIIINAGDIDTAIKMKDSFVKLGGQATIIRNIQELIGLLVRLD